MFGWRSRRRRDRVVPRDRVFDDVGWLIRALSNAELVRTHARAEAAGLPLGELEAELRRRGLR